VEGSGMSRLKQQARVMAAVQAEMQTRTPSLDIACEAWRAVDRLAQMKPAELAEQRGVMLAMRHKLDVMIEVLP
jgi:hypothetical protein